jgi:hypothetical protein
MLKIPPLIIDTIITLLLNNHVMHDHASIYELPYLQNTPLPSRMSNNGLTRLQNTKCSLHILPASLLFLSPTSCIYPLCWQMVE